MLAEGPQAAPPHHGVEQETTVQHSTTPLWRLNISICSTFTFKQSANFYITAGYISTKSADRFPERLSGGPCIPTPTPIYSASVCLHVRVSVCR